MNLDDILAPILSAFGGSAVTWWFGRSKEKTEIQTGELGNTETAIKIWREMAQEMSDKVKDLSDKVDALTKEVHNLRIENADLKLKLDIDNDTNVKPTKKTGRLPQN
jgi:predicted RNase H-like nuclease (RuvC/YqgF family)